ncbi:MAG: hypothetical protein JSU76_00680 [Dehalococcoidia bacterium]|nr:MAG: hypothetical protein JSU76_00680 [Dehalococcoidia bacterium]
MVTVTALAAEKLKEGLQAATTDPEVCIRLALSSSVPNRIEMVLDKAKEEDQIAENEGTKLIILDPEIAQQLEGMVIDYEESPQGVKFTLTKLAPDK